MNSKLSHKERIDRHLSGKEIDRPAVSAWRHFYDRENTKGDLVNSMLEFQKKFDWDFMKINSRASYHVEDWGVRFGYSTDPLKKPVAENFPVAKKADWRKIERLDWRSGSLGEILAAGKEILDNIGSEIYCVPTIFSPLSIAADLVESDEKFIELAIDGPEELHTALEKITETFSGYVREMIEMGMAGIFFATTEWATRERLTEDQYLEFGRHYDLKVLGAASGGFFNIMHVCKTNNMLPLFRDYPVPVLSWNPFEEGNLSIEQADQISDKIFMTGVDQNGSLLNGSTTDIEKQVAESINSVPPGRLIIGPGCAVKVNTPEENLFALSETAKGWNL
jgi:uroporphyrinogen decarboxylase